MKNNRYRIWVILMLGLLVVSLSSCDSFLPDDVDTFADDTQFVQKIYRPILGRNVLMSDNFNPGNSSRPFSMQIVNLIRKDDGEEATELMENFPVKIWTKPYLGDETSLEEIEAKRTIEYRPLFSIREHSGEFMLWASANSSFVSAEPAGGYTFDVEVTNSGGRRYFEDFQLVPQRERPYEPSIYDPMIGIAQDAYVRPLTVTNVKGATSGFEVTRDDIEIYFNKNQNADITGAKTLTFRFFDTDYNPINPNLFNLTNWEDLIHGFDMELTDEYVRYKVAYPIPLVEMATSFTNNAGDMAHTEISYDRLNVGGFKEVANIEFDFSIYEEGHWEIIMVFTRENPKFQND